MGPEGVCAAGSPSVPLSHHLWLNTSPHPTPCALKLTSIESSVRPGSHLLKLPSGCLVEPLALILRKLSG